MNVYRYRVQMVGDEYGAPSVEILEIVETSRAGADFMLEKRLDDVGRYTATLLGVRQIVTEEIPPDPRVEVLRELEKTADDQRSNYGLTGTEQEIGHVLVDLFRTTRERLEKETDR